MINRIKCWLGLHEWSNWRMDVNPVYVWYQRECKRCGKIENR